MPSSFLALMRRRSSPPNNRDKCISETAPNLDRESVTLNSDYFLGRRECEYLQCFSISGRFSGMLPAAPEQCSTRSNTLSS